jgi:hypothetical protein
MGYWCVAHPLKGFDHTIFGPSQNDDMGIGDNDPHPALGDRVLFAHSGEHQKSHEKTGAFFHGRHSFATRQWGRKSLALGRRP